MRKSFIGNTLFLLLLLTAVCCSPKDESEMVIIKPPVPEIIDIQIPNNIFPTIEYTIKGRGFYVGDTLVLRSIESDIMTKSVASAFGIDFIVPAGSSGNYDLGLWRNNEIYDLDEIIKIATSFDLNDVTVRSKYVRKEGLITIRSSDIKNGDSVMIENDSGLSMKLEGVFKESGNTNSLTFQLPKMFSVGLTEVADSIKVSVVRVGLTAYATDLEVLDLVYTVGDYLGGGVVFFNDPMTLDAYVVSLSYSPGIPWGPVNQPEYEIKTTNEEIGTGQTNTQSIIAKQGSWNEGRYSAKYCDDFFVEINGVSYDDWFLPSVDEALVLFNAYNEVNSTLDNYGGDKIGPPGLGQHFQTSSEINGSNYAYFIVIDQSPVTYINGKDWETACRPIRLHHYEH